MNDTWSVNKGDAGAVSKELVRNRFCDQGLGIDPTTRLERKRFCVWHGSTQLVVVPLQTLSLRTSSARALSNGASDALVVFRIKLKAMVLLTSSFLALQTLPTLLTATFVDAKEEVSQSGLA